MLGVGAIGAPNAAAQGSSTGGAAAAPAGAGAGSPGGRGHQRRHRRQAARRSQSSASGQSGASSGHSSTGSFGAGSGSDGSTPGSDGSTPGSSADQTGGSSSAPANPTVPGTVAQLIHGVAYAPQDAPPAVQNAIWTANHIVGKPYVYGGGHGAFQASGYDCSGTVSYALHGAHLLGRPMDSSELMRWGRKGAGQWITVYSNPGHAYMVIAGLRLDTSSADDPGGAKGPRWRPLRNSDHGYRVRHVLGF